MIANYENYFQHIANIYTRINHFFAVDFLDYDTFINSLKGNNNKTGDISLLLEHYTRTKKATNTDNQHYVLRCAYTIVCRIDLHNEKDKSTVLANTEAVAMAVENRIILDYENQTSGFMTGLILESFTTEKADIWEAPEFVGHRTSFTIEVKKQPKLVKSEWSEYTPFFN